MFDHITDDAAIDFDALDEAEAATADYAREVLTGLPARPGTRR